MLIVIRICKLNLYCVQQVPHSCTITVWYGNHTVSSIHMTVTYNCFHSFCMAIVYSLLVATKKGKQKEYCTLIPIKILTISLVAYKCCQSQTMFSSNYVSTTWIHIIQPKRLAIQRWEIGMLLTNMIIWEQQENCKTKSCQSCQHCKPQK